MQVVGRVGIAIGALASVLLGACTESERAVGDAGDPAGISDAAPDHMDAEPYDRWIESCFVAGTPIATPAGEVSIEALRIGDAVLSFDHTRARVVASRVTETFVHADQEALLIALSTGRTLGVTPNHPIYSATRESYVRADALGGGDGLFELLADGKVDLVHLRAVSPFVPDVTVYNLSVSERRNYFAAGILVHNKSPPCDVGDPCFSPDCPIPGNSVTGGTVATCFPVRTCTCPTDAGRDAEADDDADVDDGG